jgi:hypothetical protein
MLDSEKRAITEDGDILFDSQMNNINRRVFSFFLLRRQEKESHISWDLAYASDSRNINILV